MSDTISLQFLGTLIKKLNADVVALNARHDMLRQQIAHLVSSDELLGMMRAFTTSLGDAQINLQIKLEAVDGKIDTLAGRTDAKFEALDAKFEAIDAKFEATDAKLEAIDAKLDALDRRFDQVVTLIGQLPRA